MCPRNITRGPGEGGLGQAPGSRLRAPGLVRLRPLAARRRLQPACSLEPTMNTIHDLLSPIRELQEEVRRAVVDACERASLDELSGIVAEEAGDTIYAVDRVSEETLVDFFSREVAPRTPLVLIAEGIEGGHVVLPRGTREEDA